MSTPFAIGIGLNLVFVVVEVVYGFLAHSMALVADAGHNLGDVLGLGLSWGAIVLAARPSSRRRTYGYRKASVLAALANAVLLIGSTALVVWESVQRLRDPSPVHGATVIAVALAGVVVNGGSALLFLRGKEKDLNVRSSYLHLAGDAAISLGVALAGGLMLFTGWTAVDSIVSILVSLFVLGSAWKLLRHSVDHILDAVPEAIDLDAVERYLGSQAGVVGVHDLHVWPMSTTEIALTAHLVVRGSVDGAFFVRVAHELEEKFEIAHATLQAEPQEAGESARPCVLACRHV